MVDIQVKNLTKFFVIGENLLEDLTRHDVSFSMESFLRDFPDFTWNHPIEEAAARTQGEGCS